MTQEEENRAFLSLLKKYGAEVLEAKIQKLDSCRKYYRRYPYDGWEKRVGEEHIDIVEHKNPLNQIIAEEARLELLDGLTERERWVAERSVEGYKPRDMAEMRGVDTSNADRWIKHSVKSKLQAKLDSRTLDNRTTNL